MWSVEFDFYVNEYGGTLIDNSMLWKTCSREAISYINQITYGRLFLKHNVSEYVMMAVCAVADVVRTYQQTYRDYDAGLKSVNNDGYSETYADMDSMSRDYKISLKQAVDTYLPPSDPLRYSGVY